MKDTYFPLVSTPSQLENIVSIQMYSSVIFVYNVYNLYKKKVLKTLRASWSDPDPVYYQTYPAQNDVSERLATIEPFSWGN